jgi:hypothetical protein
MAANIYFLSGIQKGGICYGDINGKDAWKVWKGGIFR